MDWPRNILPKKNTEIFSENKKYTLTFSYQVPIFQIIINSIISSLLNVDNKSFVLAKIEKLI